MLCVPEVRIGKFQTSCYNNCGKSLMENKSKRPRLIGFLQAILVLLGIGNGFVLLGFAVSLITPNQSRPSLYSPTIVLGALLGAILFIAAASEIGHRRNRGRLLGVASFFVLAAYASYSTFFVALNPDPGFRYFSKTQLTIFDAGQVILFIAATFYLMFSSQVIAYFNPVVEGITDPPPPPTFDE